MTAKTASMVKRTRRLGREKGPLLVQIAGNPEALRLGILKSDREALMAPNEHFIAAPDESTPAFHKRLKSIAKARGVNVVILGDESNADAPAAAPPYPPSSSPPSVLN